MGVGVEKLEGKTVHLATAFENDCMDTMAFYCLRGLVLVSEGSGRRHWHWHGTEWHGMAWHGYASNCVQEASREAGFSSSLEYG
jgi:hypothetical protein